MDQGPIVLEAAQTQQKDSPWSVEHMEYENVVWKLSVHFDS